MYHDTTSAHLAVGHSLSPVLPSEIRFQTSSEIKAVQKAHSNSRWRHRHTFSRSISMQSALDILWRCVIQIYYSLSSSSSHVPRTRLCTNAMSHHPAVTAQSLWSQSITPPRPEYLFSVSLRVGSWVGLGGWLHTAVVCPPAHGHPSQY